MDRAHINYAKRREIEKEKKRQKGKGEVMGRHRCPSATKNTGKLEKGRRIRRRWGGRRGDKRIGFSDGNEEKKKKQLHKVFVCLHICLLYKNAKSAHTYVHI